MSESNSGIHGGRGGGTTAYSAGSTVDDPCDEWKMWKLRCNPDAGDDACANMGYDAAGATKASAKADPVVQACLSNIMGCDVGDDVCYELTVLTDSARAGSQRCAGRACGEYKACVAGIFGVSVDAGF